MKVGICGDIHWSTYSSILRTRGKMFSTRLEGLVKSLSWVEETFKKYNCVEEIFLGDTFDRPDLNAEEISALSEVEWNKSSRLKHFIVGNHESGIATLVYNSTQVLHKVGVVEDTPYIYPVDESTEFLFLPYITEDTRQPLSEYLKNRNTNKKLVIFSHNDIKDFQMGMFLSKTGFSVNDIEQNCNLYINGHLHNGGQLSKKIINLGNLSGQNFSEDAFKYEHHIAILDTDTLEIEYIENPYAFNFYKIEVNTKEDFKKLLKFKDNAVVSIQCKDTLVEDLKDVLSSSTNILTYKLVIKREQLTQDNASEISLGTMNHLKQFRDFILSRDDIDLKIAEEELFEVCREVGE